VAELSDRIVNPRLPARASQPLKPVEVPQPAADVQLPGAIGESSAPLFAQGDSGPINPADVQFAFDSAPRSAEKFDFRDPSKYQPEPPLRPTVRSRPDGMPVPKKKKKRAKKILGMDQTTFIVMLILLVLACACVGAGAFVMIMNPNILSPYITF
jgi:hypothetical protein